MVSSRGSAEIITSPAMLSPRGSVAADTAAFSVSFSYFDRYKAQATVREIVTAFTEMNVITARAKASQAGSIANEIEEHKAGENLEVLDPASLPEDPASLFDQVTGFRRSERRAPRRRQ